MMIRWLLAITLLLSVGCAHLMPGQNNGRRFSFERDGFAFANETVFHYENGEHVDTPKPGGTSDQLKHSCFVMSRAAVQFWKFARFLPDAAPVPPNELARRIRLVSCRTVWAEIPTDDRRIEFPGFRDLHDLSAREGLILRTNLDSGLATYFHLRNWRMPFVPGKRHQARLHVELDEWLQHGHPMILWLYNFPGVNINHVVVVFAQQPANGVFEYLVYDPNFTDRPRVLRYDPQTRTFSYEKTFYFPGGAVHALPAYTAPLQ